MNSEDNFQRIEISIEEAKKMIAKRDKLVKLSNNQDFIDIIDDGYFIKEASRVVLLKAAPSMSEPAQQKSIDDIITGIGQLREYFRTIMNLGATAEKSLTDLSEARQEMLQEEAING